MDPNNNCLLHPAAPWYIYILCCRDGCYYTGITTDPKRRLGQHNSARGGAKFTRARRPVRLVYCEPAQSRSAATIREYQIKLLTAADKEKLIAARSHSWSAGQSDTAAGEVNQDIVKK